MSVDEQGSRRIEWLDFARGASIFLVVVFHASIACEKYECVHRYYWELNNFLSPIRMPIFFAVSGLLSRKVIDMNWSGVIDKRVLGFIYVFLLWSAISLALRQGFTVGFGQYIIDLTKAVYRPSTVLWFIWALAIYTVVAKIGKITNERLLFVAAVIVSITSYAKIDEFDDFVHNNLLRYLPFFLLGVYRAEWLNRLAGLAHSRMLPALCFMFVLGFVVLRQQVLPSAVQNLWIFLQAVLGVAIGAGLSAWACRFKTVKALPSLIGKRTLSIYVAHSLLISLLLWITATSTVSVPGAELWAVPVIAVGAILLSILLERFLSRIHFGWIYNRPRWLSLRSLRSGSQASITSRQS